MASPGMNAKRREQPRSSAEDRADNSQHPSASRQHGADIAAARGEFEGVVPPTVRRKRRCHCEERSDEAISMKLSTIGLRLLRFARNDRRMERGRLTRMWPGRPRSMQI